jgi:hypothetical protein
MRFLALLIVHLAFQGCASSLPGVAAGDAGAGLSFLFMKDDRVLTLVTVSCGSSERWETRWTIAGETPETGITYGVAPEGMKTVVAPAFLGPHDGICKIEVHSRSKRSKTHIDESLFVLDPYIRSCETERSCAAIMLKSITGAASRILRTNGWPAA